MTTALTGLDHNFEKLVVETQLASLIEFARCLGMYRAIIQDLDKVLPNKQFWILTADSHLMRAVTVWCKLFGADDNEIHWKIAPASDPAKFAQDVRAVITGAAGFTKAQWETYHKEFRDFRDTYVCHRKLVLTAKVPHMTPALEIAKKYFAWLLLQIPGTGQPKPLAEWYLEAQTEALLVLRRDWAKP